MLGRTVRVLMGGDVNETLSCADPGNWEVPYYVAADFATDFIHQRAKVAQAANKPFILEETGKAVRLLHPALRCMPAVLQQP